MKAYDDYLDLIKFRSGRKTQRNGPHNQDFVCIKCAAFVSAQPLLSGVQNRNHCPYCLHSRHMDHYHPGDRLSACKAAMRPVGLTLKATHKKYARPGSGELMLVHLCSDCGKLSINRTAADDDTTHLMHTYQLSKDNLARMHETLSATGIHPLGPNDWPFVNARLYGNTNHLDILMVGLI